MSGCMSASCANVPAMNNKKNHAVPNTAPQGNCWSTTGIVANPRLKAPPWAISTVPCGPKKA